MTSKKIYSDDFTFLSEDLLKKKPKQGRPKKTDDNKLQRKLQITVTKAEYEYLEECFNKSDFPNFGSYLRKEAKRVGLIKDKD
ncbi:hypothetical protein N9C35_04815 [Flavobacteriaceae bacterium]|nr:hypothetical protein [Flavobacteriaceae bacterium]